MKLKTIFYSYSGVTRGVAEKIQEACGGDTVEIKAKNPYSKIVAYSAGCIRAMKGEGDDIEPVSLDVSDCDVIVIGTPVWAFRAAPPINTAIEAITGCEGKTAVLFATCGATAKNTLPHLAEALSQKGVTIAGEYVLDRKGVLDEEKVGALINAVKSAEGSE